MVSQQEVISVRVKFSKTGNLMYISHLDLARTMQRIITRAGIDIWYSEGFNPQPRLTFAVPLPVGVESNCELLDFKINSYMSNEEIAKRLSDSFPEEMKVISVYNPEQKFKNIGYIDYTIELYSDKITKESCNLVKELFSKECLITKRTKSGEKQVDISKYIKLVDVEKIDDGMSIHTILTADNENYLNPEYFVGAIRSSLNILKDDEVNEHYSIIRNNMLNFDLKEFI
ncbi:MAG: DUF2344 domain-containing protein [Clostridia bacterium]|nr:DUF2344 domain-containing protein [Clostridia bacterium]